MAADEKRGIGFPEIESRPGFANRLETYFRCRKGPYTGRAGGHDSLRAKTSPHPKLESPYPGTVCGPVVAICEPDADPDDVIQGITR